MVVTITSRWPDVQAELVTALEAVVGAGHTAIETPTDLYPALPFIRVERVGGPADQLNDQPAVVIDCFAALYADAELLAETVRQYLCGPPPPVGRFDRVDCETGPQELPWGDDAGRPVRRFGATYRVTSRRHPLP